MSISGEGVAILILAIPVIVAAMGRQHERYRTTTEKDDWR